MEKYDVIIIGGNPAGGTAASTVRQFHKNKSVLVIRKEEDSLIPCGIPYALGSLEKVRQDIKPVKALQENGVDFVFDEVRSLDPKAKKLNTAGGKDFFYDKLIIATGSLPFVPPLKGADLSGVYTIGKELKQIEALKKTMTGIENLVVIGAGFIGVEVSDELKKHINHVTLIEAMEHVLPMAFDRDIADPIEQTLKDHGLEVITGAFVEKLVSDKNGRVSSVKLNDGREVPADVVILSMGYRPNVSLAENAGIKLGETGGIWTDEYLRTSYPDIFAVGDCVEHKDFFTRKPSRLMLASTAAAEARIAAMNVFKLKVIRQCKGSIAVFSSSLGDISMGAAGITESQAEKEGFEILTGWAKGKDRHPGILPDASNVSVKLVFSKDSGVLLGAQILGGKSAGEMINVLGLAIQRHMSARELSIMQYGTQPLLTSGPGVYPIVLAAMDGLSKME